MSPVRLTLIGFFVLFPCQAREENAAFCFSQSTFSFPSSTPALHSGTSEPILPLVVPPLTPFLFLWHCYLVGLKSFVPAARAAAARHRNSIQKKTNSLKYSGTIVAKIRISIQSATLRAANSCRATTQQFWNSRTRPAP